VKDAAGTAQSRFIERRTPPKTEIPLWTGEGSDNFASAELSEEAALREKSAIQLASEIVVEQRAINYVKDAAHPKTKARAAAEAAAEKRTTTDIIQGKGKGKGKGAVKTQDVSEEAVEAEPWYLSYYKATRGFVVEKLTLAVDAVTFADKKALKGFGRHIESLFSLSDALAEAVITARGPMAPLGFGGKLLDFVKYAEINPRLEYVRQPWLLEYTPDGNRTTYKPLMQAVDAVAILDKLPVLETALDHVYREEARCD